ncbi:RNA-binding protein [Caloramator sp. E03]|uniref:KOW domain-containing RNA-binding protein n=1 Tax=Caloramator sp. E03 TaxID=2576307 RepID=UPI00111040F3|nr:KOW domain-containing RNA-binding protein [Caloramator sp. E03]QCX33859.1 RNA-binding protein [Caloramator sp. E03]
MDVALGQIVHSKAGRDKGKYFVVVGIVDSNYVLIADGDLRKINNPKKKKLMHLVCHDKFAEDIREKLLEGKRINDADIRKSLQSMGLFKEV